MPARAVVELLLKGGWKLEILVDLTPGRAGTCLGSIAADLDEPSAVKLLSRAPGPPSSYCCNTQACLYFRVLRLFVYAH